jgi:Histidine kinase-, DNA gyrase B-, and HSP90-like ATPase
MKVAEEKSAPLISSGGENEIIDITFGDSREARVMMLNLVTDLLYTDKIAAVWREYGCNAADANIEAGHPETPIEITLPTTLSSEAVIRDFGYGMTEARMRDVFCRPGESTKRGNNKETGMIGIGAKAGYAYGEMFTVISINAGQKTIYQFFKENGMPRMMRVSQVKSEEPEGTEIRVPVRAENIYDFAQKAEQVFRYFRVPPIVHGGSLDYKRGHAVFHGDGWRYTGDNQPVATMGNVGYKIDVSALNLYSEAEQELGKLLKLGIELDFEIGDLEVAATREALQVKAGTRKAILDKARKAIDELAVIFKDQIAAASCLWDAKKLYADAFEKMGDVDKQSLRNILDVKVVWQGESINSGRIYLNREPKEIDVGVVRWTKNSSYRRRKFERQTDPEYIYPTNKVALVINDLPRGTVPPSRVKGWFAQDPERYQLVVFTFNNKLAQDSYWKRLKLEGAPTTLLSSIAPLLADGTTGNGGPSPHKAKHTAHAFSLDETLVCGYHDTKPFSKWWKTVDVDLKADSGVYVELEKFMVVNTGFIEPDTFATTVKLLRRMGVLKGKLFGFKRKDGKIKKLGKKWRPLCAELLQQLQAFVKQHGQELADYVEAKSHATLLPFALAPLLPVGNLAREYVEQCHTMNTTTIEKKLINFWLDAEAEPWMKRSDVSLPAPSVRLDTLQKALKWRYPMLTFFHTHVTDRKQLTQVAEYIEMVEQQRKENDTSN